MDYRTELAIIREVKDILDLDLVRLLEIIANEFTPEDVFSEDDLKYWAENNGYIKENENGNS